MPDVLIVGRDKSLDFDDPAKLALIGGPSYFFGGRIKGVRYWTFISTPVTADSGARLIREIIEWKRLPVNPLLVQVSEVQDLEKTLRDLDIAEEQISEEMIVSEMIQHDLVVQMPPVREYTLRVKVKSIEKGSPSIHFIESEEF